MRAALLAFFFVASAAAQNPPSAPPAACGPDDVGFKIKLDTVRHTVAAPDANKALVYFIQDDGPDGNHQHYTTRIGLDGAWAGAYKQNSYFTVSLEPGEHHICANVQSDRYPDRSQWSILSLAHFSAERGKVYFFHTQYFAGMPGPAEPYLVLNQIDSDEGGYLIANSPLSVSQPYKEPGNWRGATRPTR
jgi:hypothetical protein